MYLCMRVCVCVYTPLNCNNKDNNGNFTLFFSSEIVTGLKVFVETADGQVIKQSLSRQTLEQAFSFITTSRQERLTVVQQTSSNSFVQTSTTFSIVFTQKIKMVDYVAIEVAVAQAWNDKRTGRIQDSNNAKFTMCNP